ncbi:MAG: VCBS repeat-containing protein [Bacteroidota bacterium]|nr:VCBS repeat-containing protein [Bacteroidota bacterium]
MTKGKKRSATKILVTSLIIICFVYFLFNFYSIKTNSSPAWTPGGHNNNLFYPRPSSVLIKKPALELIWTSSYIPLNRRGEYTTRAQHLSTFNNSGSIFLAVLRGGVTMFNEFGEMLFQNRARDGAFGTVAELEGEGLWSVVAFADSSICIFNSKGMIQRKLLIPNRVDQIFAADLDNDGKYELLTSEREKIPSSDVFKRVDWDKRTIKCYNAVTFERKWEFRTATIPFVDAVEDINNDGYKEIVCGTHSLENSISYGDMIDSNRTYIFLLDHLGNRIWMRTYVATFGRMRTSVADLDNDGTWEIIVSGNSWLKNWGFVNVLRATDGKILYSFPDKGALDYSITEHGIADLDGDGIKEIVCSSVGKKGSFFVLNNRCQPTGKEYRVTPASMNYDYIHCRLAVLNDIDGDGKIEIIGSSIVEKIIANDPRFMYSQYNEQQFVILSSECNEKLKTQLGGEIIVSDLIPGGGNEIIILGEEVSVYKLKEEEY